MEKEDLYGNFEKKVQFTDSDKRYADLRLQLHFDGLRQGEFFRGLVIGYIERDEDLMAYIEKLKEKIARFSKTKRNIIARSDKNRKEIIDKFGLNTEEIEDIFDIIEKEQDDI